jgi:hypothetical protein
MDRPGIAPLSPDRDIISLVTPGLTLFHGTPFGALQFPVRICAALAVLDTPVGVPTAEFKGVFELRYILDIV